VIFSKKGRERSCRSSGGIRKVRGEKVRLEKKKTPRGRKEKNAHLGPRRETKSEWKGKVVSS